MSASEFDVYIAHYVGRRKERLLLLQEEQHFAEKEAGTQADVSGNEIPASWKYGAEREMKSPKVRVQWQRL